MQYFNHDTDASKDEKILALRIQEGGAAVDAYWYLIEKMHYEESSLCVSNAAVMRAHCAVLCTDLETLNRWIKACIEVELFNYTEDENHIISDRVDANIGGYHNRKEQAAQAAKARWDKEKGKSGSNATAKRTQSKRNANKRKEKSSITTRNTTTLGTVGAGAEAPPVQEEATRLACPECRKFPKLEIKTGKWICSEHGEVEPISLPKGVA